MKEEKNIFINFINKNTYEKISKYFNNFFLVMESNCKIIKCENLDKLKKIRDYYILSNSYLNKYNNKIDFYKAFLLFNK